MKKYLYLLAILILLSACSRNKSEKPSPKCSSIATVGVKVIRLSDIDFHDQQYSIDFQLFIDYRDTSSAFRDIDFVNQLQFPDSKKTQSRKQVYANYDKNGEKNMCIEFSCIMAENYDVLGYPFDDQKLTVELTYPVLDTSALNFATDTNKILYIDKDKIESGWHVELNQTTVKVKQKSLSDDSSSDTHSVLYFQIPLHRKAAIFIFSKLFIGMYIAFLVSFVALFISVKHVEPRFGLPVGGLFATIANKYIIESLLPLTPDFSLVDWLHTTTIVAIFLIIAFSAVSLGLRDIQENSSIAVSDSRFLIWKMSAQRKLKWMERIDSIHPRNFLILYILINILIVVILANHDVFGFS
jgi:hypothetical protein